MKKAIAISVVYCLGSFYICNPAYSWSDAATHAAITDNAIQISTIDGYLKNQLGISRGLTAEFQTIFYPTLEERMKDLDPARTNRSVLDWIKTGSQLEDKTLKQSRSRHHFHDPIRNSGLDDRTDHPEWKNYAPAKLTGYKFDFTGESAIDWAINGTSSKTPTTNLETWGRTRTRFYNAMTYTKKSDRDSNMAMTMLSLGSVVHLLEDMGVPAHARNDSLFGHYRTWYDHENDIEKNAESRVVSNGGQCPWSGSGPVVFNKLTKYFDANQYTGNYLNDGVLPPNTWGLSECTNYQFLSTSTMFGCTGTKYQFPHPAKEHLGLDIIEPVVEGKKVYFNGVNYGVSHIARKSYTQYFADEHGLNEEPIDNTNTTDDNQVFIDYANITVPRTINYATGLLNYFFRGKLEIEPNCLDCNTIIFKIRNDSNNSGVAQTLKGGSFELFWDDRDGNRTKINDFTIPGWTTSSTLNYDQQITGTFNKPDSNKIERYTVVYKGQISENPSQPDNDDSNAIAVATLKMGYPIIAWGRDVEGQVSGVPEGNDFVDVAAGKYHGLAIRSSGSLAAWGYNDYGQCNVPEGNDFIAIAGGSRHSLALRSNGSIVGFGDNTQNQIDVPEWNNFVAIACGEYHNLAINKQGRVVGWGGYNAFNECNAPEPDTGTTFVSVSAGRYHSLGLQSDGTIRAWGSNEMGQTRIYAGAGNDHEAIAAADTYNFILFTDNTLLSWGGGDWLQTGIPDYHWRMNGNDYIVIAAGTVHIAALTSDGRIFCWGYDDFNYASSPVNPVPTGVTFAKDLAAGYKFTVALKAR